MYASVSITTPARPFGLWPPVKLIDAFRLPVITVEQSTSCFVPPANWVSMLLPSLAVASIWPLNCQPLTLVDACWHGAVPDHVTGPKPFQSWN
jgi:hypothetical protein